MQLFVQEILKATGGTLLAGDPQSVITRISTDTRTLKAGDLYCALVGPHFDGHQFVEDAIKKGAKGILVSDITLSLALPPFRVPESRYAGQGGGNKNIIIHVSDTLKALGDMAHVWRKKFTKPVIAITGSSGKTSTKELLSLCLESHFKVHKTEGNLNNLVGVPLTLFQLEEECDVAIIEMGMNAFGEIARLTEIASPTMGLITNVGAAHLEGVGSLEGVAKAKGELFSIKPHLFLCQRFLPLSPLVAMSFIFLT